MTAQRGNPSAAHANGTMLGAEPDYDPELYRTLLETTMAIPWKIDLATKRFAYIGPQIENLLGFKRESWVMASDWSDGVHPDDHDALVINLCDIAPERGVHHEADYRIRNKDGDYVWIRDVVHVVCGADGEPESLVGFMFDISDRKRIEEELLVMQKRLENLSFEDGLTGVANRRRLDQQLGTEWGDACRSGRPLSLLLIDIDHFKQYNDYYGHLAGDDCLTRVASTLKQVVSRPRDLVARYGGEEFALLLPDTDEAAATHLAEKCRKAVEALHIPHAQSQNSACVTVSVGAGTMAAHAGLQPVDLLRTVDERLYEAKRNGRNRVMCAA